MTGPANINLRWAYIQITVRYTYSNCFQIYLIAYRGIGTSEGGKQGVSFFWRVRFRLTWAIKYGNYGTKYKHPSNQN